jgi:hypothetical protein
MDTLNMGRRQTIQVSCAPLTNRFLLSAPEFVQQRMFFLHRSTLQGTGKGIDDRARVWLCIYLIRNKEVLAVVPLLW